VDIWRPQSGLPGFSNDLDLLHIYDIIGKNYGMLPSEVAKLSFEDLAINVAALKARGQRIDKLMRQTKRKKKLSLRVLKWLRISSNTR
jgi:hypothetical protein